MTTQKQKSEGLRKPTAAHNFEYLFDYIDIRDAVENAVRSETYGDRRRLQASLLRAYRELRTACNSHAADQAKIAALVEALKHIRITASFADSNAELNRDRLASILQDAKAALNLAQS